MRKPVHQNVITWIIYLGSGIVLFGGLLDAISNSISLVTPTVTYCGTALVVIAWLVIEISLKKRPLKWVLSGNNTITIKKLGAKTRLPIIGIVVLLWLPITTGWFKNLYLRNFSRSTAQSGKSVNDSKPSQPDDRIRVLINDFVGPDPSQYGVSQILFEKLQDTASAFPDIELVRTTQMVSNQVEALSQASEKNAVVIIWGSYLVNKSNVRMTINFSVPQKTAGLAYKSAKFNIMGTLSALESFSIQEEVSTSLTAFTLLTIALTRLAKEDYTKAIDLLTSAINLSPSEQISDPALIFIYRAFARLSLGQYAESLADLNSAIKRNPGYGEAYSNRALIYAHQGKIREELADAEKALKLLPHDFRVLNNYAMTLFRKGDHDHAIAELTTALTISPEPLIYANRAQALALKSDITAALSDVEKGLSIDPKEPRLYLARALAQTIGGDLSGAYGSYTQAIDLAPTNPEAYMNRGTLALQMRNFDGALRDLDYAIKLDPKDARAYYNRGLLFNELNKYDQAISDLSRAIDLDPNYVLAFDQRAKTYSSVKQFELALKDIDTAMSLDPSNPDVMLNLSVTLSEMGRIDAAISVVDKAIKLAPAKSELFIQRCLYDYQARKLDKCIVDCNAAIRMKPDEAVAYVNRGICTMRKGNDTDAIKDFTKAIELNNELGAAYLNRANANKHIGAFDQAERDFSTGINLSDANSKANGYYNRGLFYAYRGNKTKAKDDLEQAANLTDNPELKDQIEQQLKKLKE